MLKHRFFNKLLGVSAACGSRDKTEVFQTAADPGGFRAFMSP